VAEKYTETALHFEATKLPRLLERHLPPGPLTLADLGCGDGPLFRALVEGGYIAPGRSVYAVDLDPARLARVSARFPWIETLAAPADSVPAIGDHALELVCSTMVLEHHKLSPHRGDPEGLAERFRRADWVDVTRGLLAFGLSRSFLREVFSTWPNAGFHKRLVQLELTRLRTHPLSPLPMLKL